MPQAHSVPAEDRIHVLNFALVDEQGQEFWLGDFEFTTAEGYIRSQVFVCSVCGRVWGRLRFLINPLQPELKHSFEGVTRPCAKHGDGTLIPETLLSYPDLLPRALLEYELKEVSCDGRSS